MALFIPPEKHLYLSCKTLNHGKKASLEKEHKFEKQLSVKEQESEMKLKNQQLESLLARIKDLESQLKQAFSKVENAESNTKEITLKAIQSSGQIKIIEKEDIRRKAEE